MKPLLDKEEFELYSKHLLAAKTVVEFGSGGSTLFALENNKKIYSVENHLPFYRDMQPQLIGKDNLYYLFINTGETNEWGVPVDETPTPTWWPYYVDIWEKVKEPVDFIFIDGRFRVMCALHALKNCKDAVVCIHDFNNREHYHVLLKCFDVVESVGTLVILKAKKEFNEQEFMIAMWEYHNDWR